MAQLATVHEEIITRSYRAPKCSTAFICHILLVFLGLAIPLVLCVVTQGLWKKTNTYLEQPRIEFTRKCLLLVADPAVTSDYFFWSSFQDLNGADGGHLVMPTIGFRTVDVNKDKTVDAIHIDIALTLPNSSFAVRHVFYYLQFKVFMDYRAVIEMEAPVMGTIDRHFRASEVSVVGDLQVLSKRPLPSHGHFEFQYDVLSDNSTDPLGFGNETDLSPSDHSLLRFLPANLMRKSVAKNFTLAIANKFEHWLPFTANDDGNTFTLHFTLFIREQELTYRTSAMELLKWFGLQYFVIFVVTKLVMRALASFLYENRILSTLVLEPVRHNKSD